MKALTTVPQVTPWLLAWFSRYASSYVGRNFRAVRVLNEPPFLGDKPAIVYLNHASWWDPLISLLLWRRFFAERRAFAPIDARALRRYGFFSRLGFFPVRQDSPGGAIDFLRSSERILAQRNSMLWVTPQGRFVDVRETPNFKPGLARIAERLSDVWLVPLAIEYVFWDERKPEVCVNFGPAISSPLENAGDSLRRALSGAQQNLAEAVKRRDAGLFKSLQEGGSGIGGIYDIWRRARAAARMESFRTEHGAER